MSDLVVPHTTLTSW